MALTTDEHAPKLDEKTFAPAPPPATFSPPAAWIDPDQSKGWIRRLLPVLRPHRSVLIGSMVASVVMLALQLSIPQVLRGAIDNWFEAPIERPEGVSSSEEWLNWEQEKHQRLLAPARAA